MLGEIKYRISNSFLFNQLRKSKVKDKTKIFVIGRNKTGTTSLRDEFLRRNFIVGNQRKFELLVSDYSKGDFSNIVKSCQYGQVFQDVPFSFPETYKYLDKAYPDSKFILSVRDSSDQWYDSITRFHSKMFGGGNVPTKENLQNAKYVYQGWMWETNRQLYKSPEEDPYRKENLVESYNNYNKEVLDYFKGSDKLLVLNLSEKNSYVKFCDFLNISKEGRRDFLWSNKTKDLKSR